MNINLIIGIGFGIAGIVTFIMGLYFIITGVIGKIRENKQVPKSKMNYIDFLITLTIISALVIDWTLIYLFFLLFFNLILSL